MWIAAAALCVPNATAVTTTTQAKRQQKYWPLWIVEDCDTPRFGA